MEKDNDKFRKPNWDNALTDWRDYPYDKSRITKDKELLYLIFDYIEKNNLIDKNVCDAAKICVDELADQASYYADEVFRLMRKKKLAHIPRDLCEKAAVINDEITILYEQIKKDVGYSGYVIEGEEKRQKSAIEFLKSNKKIFKYIKSKHLNDDSLFEPGGGQERRNFHKKLLHIIIKENGYGDWPANLLGDAAKIGKKFCDFNKFRQS